ncbi:MAG: acetolactate synthase small subunit [Actinobacteria bacterium]|uniref:Acetolactate synthase small subunit n=1 Tax=Candidatus Fonsibacter lacus TaxID=2576439 RepID=A0A965GCC6_9PROT|nr:acetolactate synthase small subunit [Candidatus Fonsibacter lacus]
MKTHILSVLVENQAGVLARVSSLFSRRGYNIEALSVGPTENSEISRITISVNVEGHALDQVIQQLDKLVNVIEILELPASTSHQVELILVRVAIKNGAADQKKIDSVLEKYGAHAVETTATSITIQQTANPTDLEALISELTPFGILELTQSGVVAMGRTINS